MSTTPSTDGKTIAIISYLWIVGLVIAFVMNNNNKDELASYHIRNSLGLNLFWLLNFILYYVLGIWILYMIIGLALFVLWLLGIIGAAQGEKKEIPVVGPLFQDWFKNI